MPEQRGADGRKGWEGERVHRQTAFLLGVLPAHENVNPASVKICLPDHPQGMSLASLHNPLLETPPK